MKNAKGRNKVAPFLKLRRDILASEAYRALSFTERAFLVDFADQFRGNNNGGPLRYAESYAADRSEVEGHYRESVCASASGQRIDKRLLGKAEEMSATSTRSRGSRSAIRSRSLRKSK